MAIWGTFQLGGFLARKARVERERDQRIHLERLQIRRFCEEVVTPAMSRLCSEFERHGRQVELRRRDTMLMMTVLHSGKVEFSFAAAASRRRTSRKQPGRHRDPSGYKHEVDRVYSLREARKLGIDSVCREIIARYKRSVPC